MSPISDASPCTPNAPRPPPPVGGGACQSPERSGLPLSRGAGAVRVGLPSRVRGVRWSGWIHCAYVGASSPVTATTVTLTLLIFMSTPLRLSCSAASQPDSHASLEPGRPYQNIYGWANCIVLP